MAMFEAFIRQVHALRIPFAGHRPRSDARHRERTKLAFAPGQDDRAASRGWHARHRRARHFRAAVAGAGPAGPRREPRGRRNHRRTGGSARSGGRLHLFVRPGFGARHQSVHGEDPSLQPGGRFRERRDGRLLSARADREPGAERQDARAAHRARKGQSGQARLREPRPEDSPRDARRNAQDPRGHRPAARSLQGRAGGAGHGRRPHSDHHPGDSGDRRGRPARSASRAGGQLVPPPSGAAGRADFLRDLARIRIQRLVRGGRADGSAAPSDPAHEPGIQPHPSGRRNRTETPRARHLYRRHGTARGDRRVPEKRARVLEPRRAGAEDRAGVAPRGAGLDVPAGRAEDTIPKHPHREHPMPHRSIMLTTFVAALALAASTSVPAQQKSGKHHTLAATLETVQWGWLDPNEPPKRRINSGATVSIETMMHAHDKVKPGSTMDEIIALRKANPGGGPHSMTGPIYVEGAEPGDVLEVRIRKIVPKPFGINFNLPGKDFPTIGALAPEMPDGFIKFFTLDLKKRQAEFKPGITLDLRPFPGTLAVGIDLNDPSPRKGGSTDPMAPVSTLRPWKNGSNMDINEIQEGSTLFIPILVKGGLVWTGDSHCRQGNGEVNLTALECSYREIVMQLIVRKDMKLEWPRIETPTHWIMTGFDEDP